MTESRGARHPSAPFRPLPRRRWVLGPVLCVAEGFDLLAGKMPVARVHPMAPFGGVVPGLFAPEVLGPEGPGAALEGAHLVHGALTPGRDDRFGAFLSRDGHLVFLEEHAVVVADRITELLQAPLPIHLAAVSLDRFFRRDLQEIRQPHDLLAADPDEPGAAGAAVAALGAGELQPVAVPGLF